MELFLYPKNTIHDHWDTDFSKIRGFGIPVQNLEVFWNRNNPNGLLGYRKP